jgi:hypothetical protein
MREATVRNKAAVIDALAAAGITSAVVVFDGYGDEGQVESIEARVGETTVQLPVTSIVMLDADENGTTSSEREMPLNEAIENLCYEYLEEAHGGWEVNDGAYGTFAFTVADGSVVLDFNLRLSDSENYEHRF